MNNNINYQRSNIKKILLVAAIFTIFSIILSIAGSAIYFLKPDKYKIFTWIISAIGLVAFILTIISIVKTKKISEIQKERKHIIINFSLNLTLMFVVYFITIFLIKLLPKILEKMSLDWKDSLSKALSYGYLGIYLRLAVIVLSLITKIILVVFLLIASKKINVNLDAELLNGLNMPDMKNNNDSNINMPSNQKSKFYSSYEGNNEVKDIPSNDMPDKK